MTRTSTLAQARRTAASSRRLRARNVNTTGTNTFKELNLAGDHRANFTRAADAYTYARDAIGLDFASTAEHSAPILTADAWRASQNVSDAFYAPGSFTTFYGFEWTPDLNHYVVLYRTRGGIPFGHDRYPDYASLVHALEAQRVDVLTIPHVSWPFPNHNIWRDSISDAYRRVGEIYSLWNSRHLVQPDDEPQLFELGDTALWTYQYAWKAGKRIGVLASSDNHSATRVRTTSRSPLGTRVAWPWCSRERTIAKASAEPTRARDVRDHRHADLSRFLERRTRHG